MNYLLELMGTESYSFSLGLVALVGFLTVVIVGSIAWYNSKRPAGWENAERPDIVPDIDKASVASSPDA